MPAPAPTTGSGPPSSKNVLASDVIMLAEGHFPDLAKGLLTSSAQALGAKMTETKEEATVVLVNPSSVDAKKTAEADTYLREGFPAMRHPDHVPYNWLAACWYADERVPFSNIQSPFLVHPDRSRDHAPLATWVSVNVNRADGEDDAHQARANVARVLELDGALVVDKRAPADLLVVDKQSKFYEVVKGEKEKNGREWQRIVERDWVDDCVNQRRMRWPAMEVEEAENDSMAEEDPVDTRPKSVGRPAGKARIDYTPEDDDFLCRYLAAYHPDGSWHSRKTFQTLVDNANKFPIISRHSAQSWHERFKKNTVQFSKRVRRFMDKRVDLSLRTKDERAASKKAAEDSAAQNEAGQDKVQSGESSTAQGEERSNGAQEQEQVQAGQTQAADQAVEGSAATAEEAKVPADGEQPQSVAEREGARLTQIASDATQNPPGVDSEQAQSTPVVAKRTVLVELDDDEEDAAQEGQAPTEAKAPVVEAIAGAEQGAPVPETSASDEAATAAVEDPVSGTAAAQGDVPAEKPAPQAIIVEVAQETIQIEAVVPETSQVASQSNGDTAETAGAAAAAAAAAEPEAEPITQDVPADSESVPDYPRQPLPLPPSHQTASASTPARQSGETESSSVTPRRRSLISEAIVTSSAKRRRREERQKSRQTDTPDTVQASIAVPPRRIAPPPSPPPERRTRDRAAEAPLTPEQWQNRVLTGQELILKKKEEYKSNITRLCKRFGLGPKELLQVVNSLPKSGQTGELYWKDMERRLEEVLG